MTKLTDTQRIVLSSAAKHDEGLATRPANLNAAAAMKVSSSLVAKGLAREIRAKADVPVDRDIEHGEIADAAFVLQAGSNGPNVLRLEGRLRSDYSTVVPRMS
jgi:hypothetical protein